MNPPERIINTNGQIWIFRQIDLLVILMLKFVIGVMQNPTWNWAFYDFWKFLKKMHSYLHLYGYIVGSWNLIFLNRCLQKPSRGQIRPKHKMRIGKKSEKFKSFMREFVWESVKGRYVKNWLWSREVKNDLSIRYIL